MRLFSGGITGAYRRNVNNSRLHSLCYILVALKIYLKYWFLRRSVIFTTGANPLFEMVSEKCDKMLFNAYSPKLDLNSHCLSFVIIISKKNNLAQTSGHPPMQHYF